ncbi:DUF898 family protein [Limibaculum sp. M0105]|uniref:DUF898 family protein n=1 Tax=Thermohalobaculum xanthum TaxID=2753746 RepID=A0A8J7M6U2_9RHOB|nr:DUF898 family protein [Thermohalobaculum xanthum]MBK0399419.1 DUF898 family protein [Thermohalobaculum xanthum]
MGEDKEQPRRRSWDLDQYHTSRGQQETPSDPFGRRTREEEVDEKALLAALYGDKSIRARYRDDGSLLLLALKTALLSVLTLGIYRFWMVTHLRRYFASAIRVDGDAIEYTGTGIEKLLGFLLALVVLAVYLGLINTGLAFLNLSFFQGNPLALNVSLLALVPFWFWASYRARRYMLSRLRWRGIRFGVEPGAWGYTWRSLLWGLLTIVTAGLALPYMHFKQAKYVTDRTWFGDQRFEQEGSWLGLMVWWSWIYVTALIFALVTWGMVIEAEYSEDFTEGAVSIMMMLWFVVASFIVFAYQISSFRYLWDNRVLGESTLGNDVSILRVFGITVGGYIATSLATLVAVAIVGAAVAGLWIVLGGPSAAALLAMAESRAGAGAEASGFSLGAATVPLVAIVVIGFLTINAIVYALTQLFLVQPVLRRKVEAMQIENPHALRSVAQRSHDEATEAGGFADALGLDVGAGV